MVFVKRYLFGCLIVVNVHISLSIVYRHVLYILEITFIIIYLSVNFYLSVQLTNIFKNITGLPESGNSTIYVSTDLYKYIFIFSA